MATAPGAPTTVSATSGNAQATVTFTAPASNGGATITGYTATSTPDGLTAAITGATAAPITVSGLHNGTAYTFTVHATNSVGNSVESSASNSVTPATVPDAPTTVTATAGNQRAFVSFVAPINNGGSVITGYTVTATDTTNGIHGGQTASGSTSPITITGLTNTDHYTFTVHATNTKGNSVESTASGSVIPTQTVPDAPTNIMATSGVTSASVSFAAPANNGGQTITGYTVTATDTIIPANGGQTVTGATSPLTLANLAPGDAYTVVVQATNSLGTSVASAVSNLVIPQEPTGADVAPPPFANATAYTVIKAINLIQLQDEMNTAFSQTVQIALQQASNAGADPTGAALSPSNPGTLWVGPSTLSALTVEAVITAHVPNPNYGMPVFDQNYATILAAVKANSAITLTSDQIQTAIKGLMLRVDSIATFGTTMTG